MKILRVTLAVHVLFFTAWGGWLLFADSSKQVVWLETAPVDPRDLLSGNYVALSYKIANPDAPGCKELMTSSRRLYVRLQETARTADTVEGPVSLWEAAACAAELPVSEDVWIEAHGISNWGMRLQYGIERFYVSEANPLRNAASGSVVAKARLQKNNTLRLLDLVKLKGR